MKHNVYIIHLQHVHEANLPLSAVSGINMDILRRRFSSWNMCQQLMKITHIGVIGILKVN